MSLGKIRTLTTFPTGDPAFDRYQQHVKATIGPALKDLASLTAPLAWILVGATGAPVFLNSWVNFGTPWAVASYMKDSLGFVHLRGLIKNGTIGSAAFTLPSGYFPHDRQMFCGIDGANTGQRLDVTEAGLVIPTSGNNGNFSLSGITFDTRS